MRNVPFNSWPKFLTAVVSAWTVYILISSLASVSDLDYQAGFARWLSIFEGYAWGVWPFLFITVALFVAVDWLVSHRKPLSAHVGGIVLTTFGLVMLYVPLVGIGKDLRRGEPIVDVLTSISKVSMFDWLWDATVFAGMLAIVYGWRYSRRATTQSIRSLELELANQSLAAELSALELELLRRQLEPHFLFNALNSVSALIRTADHAGASEALVELGDLLRYAIESEQLEYVPIEREISYARRYLSLQQLRFGDRLAYELSVDEAAAAETVPPMLLQPILENAIRHAVERTQTTVFIRVSVGHADRRIRIEVRNSVALEDRSAQSRGFGIGLSNLERRLSCIYSEDFAFSAQRVENEFVVVLSIPVKPSHDAAA